MSIFGDSVSICGRCGLKLAGELWHGPPCMWPPGTPRKTDEVKPGAEMEEYWRRRNLRDAQEAYDAAKAEADRGRKLMREFERSSVTADWRQRQEFVDRILEAETRASAAWKTIQRLKV